MKGLLKYLSPFAPDQSGAASVLYELGAITIICDAGGCTGNICGFDEPRWFQKRSAVFSAGLRDMDAILGRDDMLIEKLRSAAKRIDAEFTALVGTPVPAVIGTDYKALVRMTEKRCGLPAIGIECTGTHLYDEGEEKTYLALFQKFTQDSEITRPDTIGVLGMTPLDIGCLDGDRVMERKLQPDGWNHIFCYGMGSGLEAVRQAGSAAKNLVVSPAGVKAAEYLKQRFGIPYETVYPFLKQTLLKQLHHLSGKRVLVVHQQMAANEIRKEIRRTSNAQVTAATWFLQKEEWKEEQDLHLSSEQDFITLVEQGQYDVMIGDGRLKRAIRSFSGQFIEVPQFAVSGVLENGE